MVRCINKSRFPQPNYMRPTPTYLAHDKGDRTTQGTTEYASKWRNKSIPVRKEKQMSTLFSLGLFNTKLSQKRYRARSEDLSSTKNFGVGLFIYKDKQSATKMTASVLNQELNR